MPKFTDEELEMLSDEEREAIANDTAPKSLDEIRADEEAEAAREARESGAGAAQRVKDNAAPVADPEGVVNEEPVIPAEVSDEAAAALAAEEEAAKAKEAEEIAALEKERTIAQEAAIVAAKVADAISPKTAPAFVLEAASAHGTIPEIEAKMKTLDEKFEDGDITLAAYNKERAGYVEAITEQKMFDQINRQVQKSAAERSWKDSQATFFGANPEYSLERIKNVAIVDAVNRILETPESKGLSDAQIFEMAKVECDAVFYPNGRVKPPVPETEADAKRKADAAVKALEQRNALTAIQKEEAAKAAAVKTLAKVPVSDVNSSDDKFAALDRLTGLDFENAIAQLSPADRAAYAAL